MTSFITHRKPHLDEFVAYIIAMKEGKKAWFWPEGREPKLIRVANEEELLEYKDRADVGYLGVGAKHRDQLAGIVFDEHRGENVGECTATLVAKALGIRNDHAYKSILDSVCEQDTQRGTRHLELGQLIKTMNRWGDMSDEGMLDFLGWFIDTHVAAARGAQVLEDSGWSFSSSGLPRGSRRKHKPKCHTIVAPAWCGLEQVLAKVWLLINFGESRWYMPKTPNVLFAHNKGWLDRMVKRSKERNSGIVFVGFQNGGQYPFEMHPNTMVKEFGCERAPELKLFRKEMHRILTNEEMYPFDLANMVAQFLETGRLPAKDIWRFVRQALDAFHGSNVEFHVKCPEDFKKFGKLHDVHGVRIAVVTSELYKMSAWCRYRKGAKIIIQRNPRIPSVNVFTKSDNAGAVTKVAREVLKAEARREGLCSDQLDRLLEQFDEVCTADRGTELPGFPHWFLWHRAGQLHNGTETHQKQLTKLSLDEVTEAAKRAVGGAVLEIKIEEGGLLISA